MKFLLAIFLCLPAFAWETYFFDGRWVWTPAPGAQFAFRDYNPYTLNYMVGAVTSTNHCTGDLRDKTIVLHCTLETMWNPDFVFGGGVSPKWNLGNNPPSFRVFMCGNSRPFRVAESNVDQLNYWWSQQSVSMDWMEESGSVTLTVAVSESLWTAAHGQSSVDFPEQFSEFLSRVKQVGIMFGGGSFYDVGVAIMPITGLATFTLNSFEVREKPNPLKHANTLMQR